MACVSGDVDVVCVNDSECNRRELPLFPGPMTRGMLFKVATRVPQKCTITFFNPRQWDNSLVVAPSFIDGLGLFPVHSLLKKTVVMAAHNIKMLHPTC